MRPPAKVTRACWKAWQRAARPRRMGAGAGRKLAHGAGRLPHGLVRVLTAVAANWTTNSTTSRLGESRSTTSCLCGSGVGGDTEVVEEGLHVDAQGFVLPVDAGPVGGFGSKPGAADPGQDGADDLIAQGQ